MFALRGGWSNDFGLHQSPVLQFVSAAHAAWEVLLQFSHRGAVADAPCDWCGVRSDETLTPNRIEWVTLWPATTTTSSSSAAFLCVFAGEQNAGKRPAPTGALSNWVTWVTLAGRPKVRRNGNGCCIMRTKGTYLMTHFEWFFDLSNTICNEVVKLKLVFNLFMKYDDFWDLHA